MKINKTERNLWTAFLEEAKANRLYTAYALKALEEGHPEVAQAFLEAAGAETVHALGHLRALGDMKSTLENLRTVIEEEGREGEVMYPALIRQALAEGREDAAESFRLALEGERRHQLIFSQALAALEQKLGLTSSPQATPADSGAGAPAAPPQAGEPSTAEVFTEKGRIAAVTRIREVIFGMQDGLLTTATLGAAVAGATGESRTVVIAGLAGALGGMLSMSAGSFLGSRAEQQVQQAELQREAREIERKPAEEMAELIAIYRREGLSHHEATALAERIASDRKLWLRTLAEKELGLSPEVLTEPVKDAAAMGSSYIMGGILPLIPYFLLEGVTAVVTSVAIALTALMGMGLVKARLVQRNPLLSALEITAIGSVVAAAGYFMGVIFPSP